MSILTTRSEDSSDLVKRQALSMNIENENPMKSQLRQEKENEEANILKSYLPEKLDDKAMVTIIENTIASVGAKTIQDMGQVMSELKNQSQGRIDMKLASTMVRNLLLK